MKVLATAPESLFWYWVQERHSIYLKRQQGLPKPWTTDLILQSYRFTNPFRENDRGTIWLRQNFLEPHRDDDMSLVAFNICVYRMFNWTGTGEFLGWQTDWDADRIKYELGERLLEGQQVFTGAHIVRSAFGEPKIDSIVNVCSDLYFMCTKYCIDSMGIQENIGQYARRVRSLQKVFVTLLSVKYVGPFMAYEMVTDMRHTRLLEDATDIMTWANPGPGAQRGLQRLSLPFQPDTAAIESMRGLLQRSNRSDSLPPPEEWPHIPDLEMRDIEHSLCEFDKYCRAKFGEGQPRSRYNGRT